MAVLRRAEKGFSAGPGDASMADSYSTQEMLQNAMVESSVGARSRPFVAVLPRAERGGSAFCTTPRFGHKKVGFDRSDPGFFLGNFLTTVAT